MTLIDPLREQFISHLPAAAQPGWANQQDLEARLLGVLASVRCQWPTVALDDRRYLEYLADRWPADRQPDELPKLLNLGDLYLAAACVHVCPGAVEVFEQHCIRHVPSFLSYLNQGPDFVAEVQQILREKLLTAPEEQLPKLADYSGRGALLMWVRAAAIRTALHQLDRAEVRKRISAEEEESVILHGVSGGTQQGATDPEVSVIKQQARAVLRESLREAIGSLEREQRTLLRFYYVDDLRVEEIGALLKVNKSTVSRRLADARDTILAALRKALAVRLKLSRSEVDSMVNLVASQLDASLASLLRSAQANV